MPVAGRVLVVCDRLHHDQVFRRHHLQLETLEVDLTQVPQHLVVEVDAALGGEDHVHQDRLLHRLHEPVVLGRVGLEVSSRQGLDCPPGVLRPDEDVDIERPARPTEGRGGDAAHQRVLEGGVLEALGRFGEDPHEDVFRDFLALEFNVSHIGSPAIRKGTGYPITI